MTRAMHLLFPGRGKRASRSTSPLQTAVLTGIETAVNTHPVPTGMLEFLPLLHSALTATNDDDLRKVREVLRTLVGAMDEADTPMPTCIAVETWEGEGGRTVA